MDEEFAAKIVERDVEAYVCETEQEHINAQWIHCNMDDVDDCESHCDETQVDDDYKFICELVNLAVADGFGEVEIINQIHNKYMHAQISHHSVDENYVDDMCALFFEAKNDYSGNMVSGMFDETLKVEVTIVAARY